MIFPLHLRINQHCPQRSNVHTLDKISSRISGGRSLRISSTNAIAWLLTPLVLGPPRCLRVLGVTVSQGAFTRYLSTYPSISWLLGPTSPQVLFAFYCFVVHSYAVTITNSSILHGVCQAIIQVPIPTFPLFGTLIKAAPIELTQDPTLPHPSRFSFPTLLITTAK